MSYGCFNRPPLKDHHWVQSGYVIDELSGTRTDKMIPVANLMTKTCQYQKHDKYNDPGCVGCCHKKSEFTAVLPPSILPVGVILPAG